jgi:hypothetical protein
MKTKFFELNWRRIILVSVLLGASFSIIDLSTSSTKANQGNGVVCPAPPECRTACQESGTKGSPPYCSNSCGMYTCS